MKFEYVEIKNKVSDEELLGDLKIVAFNNGMESISMKEYAKYGKYDCTTISRRFGSWNRALSLAKIEIRNKSWETEELFDNLEKVWIRKGCQPVRRDMDIKELSYISSGAYLRRYGKWSEALKAFVNYVNSDDIGMNIDNKCNEIFNLNSTKRDINLRLRFTVLQHDNFKCCACGASPAKDPSVELHIDHIVPWSKGGETVIKNLQTLCSKCNWGKGNVEYPLS